MPRRARLSIAGIPWHIMHRGNNRSPCFFRPDDYRHYLRILSEQAILHACAIHAYVLMTNHVHLLITPAQRESTANMMKLVAQYHTQYINRTYERSGTLWEGRFKSCLSREESYILTCYRYIELNPVRAGMVTHPDKYPWSSYGRNGGEQFDPMLTPHQHYLGMGATASGVFGSSSRPARNSRDSAGDHRKDRTGQCAISGGAKRDSWAQGEPRAERETFQDSELGLNVVCPHLSVYSPGSRVAIAQEADQ